MPIKFRLPDSEYTKCSREFTKVMALCYSVNAWLYDLQMELEKQGLFEKEIKRGVNRALTISNRVVTGVYDNLKSYDKIFVDSYTQMGDNIVSKLDLDTPLEGIERSMNMIQTSCYLIVKKMIFVRAAHFYFNKMEDVDAMGSIMGCLSPIKFESIGLMENFERQLETLFDKNHEHKRQSK